MKAERCQRCRHRFDREEEGFATVNLDPSRGLAMRMVVCGTCRDALRSWLGIAPVGVDPALLP